MIKVSFCTHDEIEDELLKFAVIAARFQDKWIFCRHKERSTWEIPGGHREAGEDILSTSRRELYEETGAIDFEIYPICIYGVTSEEQTSYGMLFYAEVRTLDSLPQDFEIAELILSDTLPKDLTYPSIQPHLHKHIQGWLNTQEFFERVDQNN